MTRTVPEAVPPAASRPVLLHCGDPGYEQARQALVWQAVKPARYPRTIWPVRSADEVSEAITYARERDLRVAVVSGGHSYAAAGLQDGTLLIDLSGLRSFEIDADARRGWVGPGVRVAAFDAALARAGLAFPVGHEPNVGLVGFLLGGGLGWNPNRWGDMACFAIAAAEVVLASGETVTVDAVTYPDLFWAVRGAGALFCGVVTKLHLALFPRPAAIRRSRYTFPLDALPSVAAWLDAVRPQADDRVELSATLLAGPVPCCSVSVIAFCDTHEEAAAVTDAICKPLPAHLITSRDDLSPRTFAGLLDETRSASGMRRDVEGAWTDDPAAACLAAAEAIAAAPCPGALVDVAFRRRGVPPADAALTIMGRGFVFVEAAWKGEDGDAAARRWVDDTLDRLRPIETGTYVNETNWISRPDRLARAFSAKAMARLKATAHRYDSDRKLYSSLVTTSL